jgi:hypothetical protein
MPAIEALYTSISHGLVILAPSSTAGVFPPDIRCGLTGRPQFYGCAACTDLRPAEASPKPSSLLLVCQVNVHYQCTLFWTFIGGPLP